MTIIWYGPGRVLSTVSRKWRKPYIRKASSSDRISCHITALAWLATSRDVSEDISRVLCLPPGANSRDSSDHACRKRVVATNRKHLRTRLFWSVELWFDTGSVR